ncbi:MAG: sugar ABC transporter ATP-binding protein [Geminicoccaceae bacterium]
MSRVSKSFPGVRALDDVSLIGHAGEVIGLVGVNGAGKSTLMNILGGVYQADSGEILVNGENARLNSPKDADRYGIAFIHQELLFFASQTVAENIFISNLPTSKLLPIFVDKTAAIEKAEIYLAMLGADIKGATKMEELSVGEKQIVEIARALATGSEIVIFDEPTSSLSVREKRNLFEVIRRLKSEGKTIIYISHFLDEIMELCDSFFVLRNGKVAGQGRVEDTIKNDIIRMVVGQNVAALQGHPESTKRIPALKVEHLRSGDLLNDISFQLFEGEILGVWGLMGSGRTELVRTILGLDRLDRGEILFAEEGELRPITPDRLLRHCGYVTESRHDDGLFDAEPVWKNITATNLGAYTSGLWRFLDTRREADTAREFISSLNIKTPDHTTVVNNLSGGNQQKVIFSKWLNKRPKILILDEPTRGVDIGAKREIGNLINSLASDGTATLLITSEVEEMVELCDRVLVLRDGTIIHDVDSRHVDEATLLAMALGEDRIDA